jgi:hypothetical protein
MPVINDDVMPKESSGICCEGVFLASQVFIPLLHLIG